MALVRPRARILEITTTSGNGPYTLAGAADGSYNNFASFMAVGDTTYVTVVQPDVAFWSGIVTYSATNQITLTTVEEAKGTFSAGTKEIFAGQLASKAMFPEDISGAIVTGGTSTAYTVASYRKYDTLTRLNGNMVAFTPHATNGATVTLNVDGLGAKPLRAQPGVELPAGSLILGTPYVATYNNSSGVWYLQSGAGIANAYSIPLGAGLDYWGSTTPNSIFAFPAGQAISRTTYATLFSLFGTTYGAGDGSTTFNLPDKSGRASFMKESTATRLTMAGGGIDGGTLGALGGSQNVTLAANQIPSLTSVNASQAITVLSSLALIDSTGTLLDFNPPNASGFRTPNNTSSLRQQTSTGNNSISVAYTNGSQAATKTVPPGIVCNYIMRVL